MPTISQSMISAVDLSEYTSWSGDTPASLQGFGDPQELRALRAFQKLKVADPSDFAGVVAASAPSVFRAPVANTGGNPAPHRGLLPTGLMYDPSIDQLYPDSAYFVRGFVDVNIFTQNLALQALAGTTKVL